MRSAAQLANGITGAKPVENNPGAVAQDRGSFRLPGGEHNNGQGFRE